MSKTIQGRLIYFVRKDPRGDTNAEFIASIRRGRDDEPLPKQKKPRENNQARAAMRIKKMILSHGFKQEKISKTVSKVARNSKRNKGRSITKALASGVEKYDVVVGIAQANASINIGQLM